MESGVLPTVYLVARFIRFYGPDYYRNPLWPTRDRVIPMRLFFVMLEQIANVQAAEELQQYYATLLAVAQVWGGKESQPEMKRALDALRKSAYPRVPKAKE